MSEQRGRRAGREYADHALSRRERQIMGVVYRLGRATVADIVAHMPDPPTQDAVRRMANILEEKGMLRHEQDGARNVYHPTVGPEKASRRALEQVVETFFSGSPHKLVAALLDVKKGELNDEDIRRLAAMIDAAAANASEDAGDGRRGDSAIGEESR
jgi:predicted transcriptional regulator